jgi:hypothetical protein
MKIFENPISQDNVEMNGFEKKRSLTVLFH